MDWWAATLGTVSVEDPKGATASKKGRSICGGSWSVSAQNCRSAIRFHYFSLLKHPNFGLRITVPVER